MIRALLSLFRKRPAKRFACQAGVKNLACHIWTATNRSVL